MEVLYEIRAASAPPTAATTSGNQYLARPSDFLSVFSLAVVDGSGNYSYLYDKDVNFIREAYPSASTTGLPKYYAQFDGDQSGTEGNFILGPTPDSAYTTELHYFYRPGSLTAGAGSGTTWLSENAELPLLYGSLIEGYIYMKGGPDVMAQYEKRFVEAISALKMFGEAKEVTDQYRTGMVIRQQQ